MKNVLKYIKNKLKDVHLIAFITKYLEDILILGGLTVIVKTTFLLSKIAGMYTLGFILLALGFYFAKHPPERG